MRGGSRGGCLGEQAVEPQDLPGCYGSPSSATSSFPGVPAPPGISSSSFSSACRGSLDVIFPFSLFRLLSPGSSGRDGQVALRSSVLLHVRSFLAFLLAFPSPLFPSLSPHIPCGMCWCVLVCSGVGWTFVHRL